MKTLRDIPIGGFFRLSKTGVTYKKISEQGMDNCIAYVENIVKKPSRKCHKGIKQISKFQTTQVFVDEQP